MDLISTLQKIRKDFGEEVILSSNLIGVLKDYQAFMEEEAYMENVLTQIVNGGFIKEILDWKGIDGIKYANNADALANRISVKYATQQEAVLNVVNKLCVGFGIITEIPKQASNKANPIVSSQIVHPSTGVASIPSQDNPLPYLSNGDDCSMRGKEYLDTELPVTQNSSILIGFNAAKWDGPIAGFRVRKYDCFLNGNRCDEAIWQLTMSQHKLVFNFPIIQKKQVDLGTFLPNNDYIVQTVNCVATICKTVKPNLSDTFGFYRNIFKYWGMQGVPENWNESATIKLFRCGDDYAWQNLKIKLFQVKEGNVTVADMVPVIHNGDPCMYDIVRQRYFYMRVRK